MLLNAQGKNVTNVINKMAKDNPHVFHKNRENILRNLREVHTPNEPMHHAQHNGEGMFSIGMRAVMR